ncbi:hypothetical protein ABFS82_14G146200 [Erythranthe guttata]
MSGGNPPADLAEFVQWSSVKCSRAGPKTVHLFANREHIRFRNVDKFFPFETITCFKETQWNVDVLFVHRLIMFIDTNRSSEITKVQKIVLYGNTMDDDFRYSFKEIGAEMDDDFRYSFKEIGADAYIPLDMNIIVKEEST